MTNEPTIEDVREASERIRPYVHCTPVLTCGTLNELCDAEIFFKCENFQKVGAFKKETSWKIPHSLNIKYTIKSLRPSI